MVVVSYSGKEINAKLVYYGCGLCGKTTNLEAIYEAVPDTSRGKMVSMKTQSDRTLFFDLLPLDLGEIMGFKTRFLLYTVPGQVFYNATRKLVLKGADAIVFVADSEVGKMEENKESLENLRANLAEYRVNLDELPWVIQYNKRDLPNVYSIKEMQDVLDPTGKVPHFEAVATHGKGVFETFRGISHLLMEKVTKELRRGSNVTMSGRPASPVQDPPATRAETVAASAPPSAPGRTIAREAQVTAPPEPVSPIDYGREIELPSQIPPPAPARETVAASASVVTPPEPVTVAASIPVAEPQAPAAQPRRESAPEPRRDGHGETRHETVVPRHEAAPEPRRTPEPVVTVEASKPAAEPMAATNTVVVPVTLPANGVPGELVIRIEFRRA